MELININKAAYKEFCELTNSRSTNALDKNPVNGGIPPREKKIITNETAQRLFILKKFVKLEINKEDEDFL